MYKIRAVEDLISMSERKYPELEDIFFNWVDSYILNTIERDEPIYEIEIDMNDFEKYCKEHHFDYHKNILKRLAVSLCKAYEIRRFKISCNPFRPWEAPITISWLNEFR